MTRISKNIFIGNGIGCLDAQCLSSVDKPCPTCERVGRQGDVTIRWCRAHECYHLSIEFYRDSTMPDNLMDVCKEEMKRRREIRRDKGLNRAASRKYSGTVKGKVRQAARNAVMKALRNGLIQKPVHCQFGELASYKGMEFPADFNQPFTECLRSDLEHHHYRGYAPNQILSIVWLCSTHHALVETEER